jgi:hypothetical protein
MLIENVLMETPEKYHGAYNYYKKHLESNSDMTKVALLAQVARMFMIDNFKKFQQFVKDIEENPRGF